MAESVFQTLLLLAYFNITLVAITIANYAVSASYLGRESRLSRWRMERKRGKLVERLKELRETTQVETIKNEIKEDDQERARLRNRIFLLSWTGAVLLPLTLFGISLVCAIIGMNSEVVTVNIEAQQLLQQQSIIASVATSGGGFLILLLVVRTIDSAARKLPIPEFDVYFENRTNEITLKRNEKAMVTVYVDNKGEDIAENVEVFIAFPKVFKIIKGSGFILSEGGGPKSRYQMLFNSFGRWTCFILT